MWVILGIFLLIFVFVLFDESPRFECAGVYTLFNDRGVVGSVDCTSGTCVVNPTSLEKYIYVKVTNSSPPYNYIANTNLIMINCNNVQNLIVYPVNQEIDIDWAYLYTNTQNEILSFV
jgi:hypothetical protein